MHFQCNSRQVACQKCCSAGTSQPGTTQAISPSKCSTMVSWQCTEPCMHSGQSITTSMLLTCLSFVQCPGPPEAYRIEPGKGPGRGTVLGMTNPLVTSMAGPGGDANQDVWQRLLR